MQKKSFSKYILMGYAFWTIGSCASINSSEKTILRKAKNCLKRSDKLQQQYSDWTAYKKNLNRGSNRHADRRFSNGFESTKKSIDRLLQAIKDLEGYTIPPQE